METLPFWTQMAANLGVFVVAAIAAAFGFMRKMASGGLISDAHFEEGGAFHKTGDDIRELTDQVKRLADIGEGALKIMQNHARDEDIDREVARRLKERGGQ